MLICGIIAEYEVINTDQCDNCTNNAQKKGIKRQ